MVFSDVLGCFEMKVKNTCKLLSDSKPGIAKEANVVRKKKQN